MIFSVNKKEKAKIIKPGKNKPKMVPSRVLLGLILGKIKFFPKTFPKTKAQISERTEIIKAEKKIALVKESFIT